MRYFLFTISGLLLLLLGFLIGYNFMALARETSTIATYTMKCSWEMERLYPEYLDGLADLSDFEEQDAIAFGNALISDDEACSMEKVVIHAIFLTDEHLVILLSGDPTVTRDEVFRTDYRVEIPLPTSDEEEVSHDEAVR